MWSGNELFYVVSGSRGSGEFRGAHCDAGHSGSRGRRLSERAGASYGPHWLTCSSGRSRWPGDRRPASGTLELVGCLLCECTDLLVGGFVGTCELARCEPGRSAVRVWQFPFCCWSVWSCLPWCWLVQHLCLILAGVFSSWVSAWASLTVLTRRS